MNRSIVVFLLFFLFSMAIYAQSQIGCQNEQLNGTYILVKDSDGTTPKDGAVIKLVLESGSVFLEAIMPGTEITSGGTYSACKNKITLTFDDLEQTASNKSFSYSNNLLTLPFVIISEEESGSSIWKKVSENEEEESDEQTADEEDESENEEDAENETETEDDESSDSSAGSGNRTGTGRSGNPAASDDDISPYVGNYIGTGWGWEVRFKHTSGEFVSQFTGADPNELPFDGDRVIMSLLVEHATKFKINIDEAGDVTGEGEIVYNLIPNLCGVAVLTEQVNKAVNLMGMVTFFFELGSEMGKRAVQSFEGTFLGMQAELANKMIMLYETGAKSSMEYAGYVLPNTIKNLDESSQQDAAICGCAAGMPGVGAGAKIGPGNMREFVLDFGIDVAKSVFMDLGKMGGLLLSIPGITQIQYYYKGLQNGPETRKFDITGTLVDGQLYLEMDGDVYGGPTDLTIEYMVNLKKETPTFPTWSPFLNEGATMFPADSETTIYEQKTKTVKKEYTDYVTGQKKTASVPYKETVEKIIQIPFPYGTFRKAGKQRNGVQVWHEYEYNWQVLKTND